MDKEVKQHHVILALLLFLPLAASPQRTDFLGRSELLLAGGGMFYIGDLNNQSALSMPHWQASAALRSRIDNRWAFRLQLTYGGVECLEDYLPLRNLSFRSTIYEGTAVVEFNFRPFGPGATESQWTPYIFGGLGVFHFNPEAPYTDGEGITRWAELQPLHTEGQGSSLYPERRAYPLMQLCLPFGVGVKWRLGKTVSLAVEYGFRKTWTDYLDDVSTTYVGSELLESQPTDGALAAMLADRSGEVEPSRVNAAGIKRGDDSLDDWYSCLSLHLGFSLETLFGWMRPKRCKL